MRTIRAMRWKSWAGLTLGVAATLAVAPAQGQYATSIPFKPWTSQYEEFVYPITPNNLAIPNQARFSRGGNLGGGSVFDPYTFDEGVQINRGGMPGGGSGAQSGYGGRYVPYSSAFRFYDQDFNRSYQPNAQVDEKFYANRTARDNLYIRAISESDPVKRSELMREWRESSSTANPDENTPRRRQFGGGRVDEAEPLTAEDAARQERIRSNVAMPNLRRTGISAAGPTPVSRRPAGSTTPTPEEVLRGGAESRNSSTAAPVQSGLPNAGRQATLDPIFGTPATTPSTRSRDR